MIKVYNEPDPTTLAEYKLHVLKTNNACPRCGGSGKHGKLFTKCSACKGTGQKPLAIIKVPFGQG